MRRSPSGSPSEGPLRPFIGREAELALLHRAAQQLEAGQSQAVFVEGFAGVGKTYLVQEVLAGFPQHRQISVLVDAEVAAEPGGFIRHLFSLMGAPMEDLGSGGVSSGEVTSDEAAVEELIRCGVARIQEQEEPLVLFVEDIHAVDDLSAEVLHRICAGVSQAVPVLLIMCGRPVARPAITRLARFAAASPYGTHMTLEPFTAAEIDQLLRWHLRTPVGQEAIDLILQETAGYPLLVEELAAHLSAQPVGRRGLPDALRAVQSGPGQRHIRQALEQRLARLSQDQVDTLKLLAAAPHGLTTGQLEQLRGRPADVGALLETGLAVWEDIRFGCRIRSRVIGAALLELLTPEQRVEIHRDLTEVVEASEAVHPQMEMLKLLSAGQECDAVAQQVRLSAESALQRGDEHAAFERYLLLARHRPTPENLWQMINAAVPLGRMDVLEPFDVSLRSLDPGPLRQGALALLAVVRDDLDTAVAELEAQHRLDFSMRGSLIYAKAVAEVSIHLMMRGAIGRAGAPRMRALMMLSAYEENLRQRAAADESVAGPAEGTPDADAHLPREISHTVGLSSLIEAWQLLEQYEPHRMNLALNDFDELLQRLEDQPGTEVFQAVVRVARGIRRRQIGDPVGAYEDLCHSAALPQGAPFAIYARTQLAMVLFAAGYWREAHEIVAAAAGRVLLHGEGSASLFSYAISALVPAACGEDEELRPLLEELEEPARRDCPMAAAALDTVEAWAAVVSRDHEMSVQHLLSLRDAAGGWWSIGVESMLLLARSAHYAGWGSMIRPLRQSLGAGESPIRPEYAGAALDYLDALLAWDDGQAEQAAEKLWVTVSWHREQPPLRSGQLSSEGGGYRLHRAFACLDFAAAVVTFGQRLEDYRTRAEEAAEWAAAVFRGAGAARLMEQALEAASVLRAGGRGLRGGGADGVGREPGAAGAGQAAGERAVGEVGAAGAGAVGASGGVEAVPGVELLTPREKQIALLVADGGTNRQVAEDLSVSVRTVDYHVRNVLAKLRLRSRRELRQLRVSGHLG